MSTKRVRLSRNTWINSLMSICQRRAPIIVSSSQPLLEGEGRQSPHNQREDGQRPELIGQLGQGAALQKNVLEQRNKVSSRNHVGDGADGRWHLLDGNQKAGEHERRQKGRRQRRLAGRQLVLGDHGNEIAQSQCDYEKQGGTDEQRAQVA